MTRSSQEQLLPTRRATVRLGQSLAKALNPGDLVVLVGGLGAGKTFLVRATLRALGVPESVPVVSPTFVLVTEYDRDLGTRLPVVHADLYRLLGASNFDHQVLELGLRARSAEGWAALVEWGQDALPMMGGDALVLRFESHPRRVVFEPTGAVGSHLYERLLLELSRG